MITFDIIETIEPRVRTLLIEVLKRPQDELWSDPKILDPGFINALGVERACRYDAWMNDYRNRLRDLVGFGAEDPRIQTSEAYDVACAVFCRAIFDRGDLPPAPAED